MKYDLRYPLVLTAMFGIICLFMNFTAYFLGNFMQIEIILGNITLVLLYILMWIYNLLVPADFRLGKVVGNYLKHDWLGL